jgi:hypothetical protein
VRFAFLSVAIEPPMALSSVRNAKNDPTPHESDMESGTSSIPTSSLTSVTALQRHDVCCRSTEVKEVAGALSSY